MPKYEKPIVKEGHLVFDQFLKIKKELLSLPEHKDHDYYSLITPADSINVIPVTKKGTLILSEEYRHPTRQYLLSCPGGYIDKGETPEQAAIRELAEETGCVAEKLQLLGSSYPYPGISAQKIYYFVALNAEKKGAQHLDANELIYPMEMSLQELEQAIKQGRAVDGVLCTALYFYQSWVREG